MNEAGQRTLSRSEAKTLALSSLGGTLEFYDFIIFVFFAGHISKNFFPAELSEFWQLFNTYGVFAAGYLARPLGGIVMAHFGDKFGRKNMFMLSILLMVIPTFALGFVPGFETLGYSCVVILILIRVCQGIAIGGELPGAWVFIHEHAPAGRKRIYIGVLTASVVSGILLGSLVFLLMNAIYTPEQLTEWAWRLPFFLGGIFGVISVYLRKFLTETPIFVKMKEEQALERFPLGEVFKRAKLGIILSMLITWVLTGCIVVLILTIPAFMGKMLSITPITQTYLQIGGIISISLGCIFSGWAAERFGMARSCVGFAFIFGLCTLYYFDALYSPGAVLAGVGGPYLLVCFFAGIMNFCPMMMSEAFEPKIKFSGLSFSYNIAYAIAGGLTPQLTFALHSLALANLENASRLALGGYILILALVSLLCAGIFAWLSNSQRTYY